MILPEVALPEVQNLFPQESVIAFPGVSLPALEFLWRQNTSSEPFHHDEKIKWNGPKSRTDV